MIKLTQKKTNDLLSRCFSIIANSEDAGEHTELLRELHRVLAPGSSGNARRYYASFDLGETSRSCGERSERSRI